MKLEDFASRVMKRKDPGLDTFDPLTILAIISAIISIAKMVKKCRDDWNKDEIVASYNAWGPLGWLRRRRVRSILAAQKLSDTYDQHVVAEASAMTSDEFQSLVVAARTRGNF